MRLQVLQQSLTAMFMLFCRKCFVGLSSHGQRGQGSECSASRVGGGEDDTKLLSFFSPQKYFIQQPPSSPPRNCYSLPLHQQFCATLSLPFPQDGTVIHSYTDYLAAAKWKKGRNLVKKVQKGKGAWGLALETNESSEGKCETAELCDCTNGP